MAASLDEFITRATESNLLCADEVAAVRTKLGHHVDAAALARALVEQGRLTIYQSHVLLQASYEPLVLGDYVILELVGQGGMGKVFRAEHRQMERIVALKMLPAEDVADVDAVSRFKREIKAAAKLSHPNIVTAYDARIDSETRYLVCEYIDGSDLSSWVKKNGPLDIRMAVDYVLQAARGLDHSHRTGIVHRDVKPSNLMLTQAGDVKVLDLGLAQFASLFGSDDIISTVSELTGVGDIIGTVDYMAPEQAVDCRNVDARADIYSLGCTLFFLLSGRPPFEKGTIVERLMAHQQKPFPSLGELRSDVSIALEELLQPTFPIWVEPGDTPGSQWIAMDRILTSRPPHVERTANSCLF
ncbi:MAG: serine/threonine-protein kinase, partial [Planctomycetota bacterium]|nr:serine/threonine-protein kinase [Planctomycetota bacterium]